MCYLSFVSQYLMGFFFSSCTCLGLSCIFSAIIGGCLGSIFIRLHTNLFLRVLLGRFLPLWWFRFLPSSLVFRSWYSLERRVAWSWILLFVLILDGTEQYQLPCNVFQIASVPWACLRMELCTLVGWDGSAQTVFLCILFSFLLSFVQLIFGQWDALWLNCWLEEHCSLEQTVSFKSNISFEIEIRSSFSHNCQENKFWV